MRDPLAHVKLTIARELEDQYRDFAREERITLEEAYETALELHIKMRNGQLSEEEVKLINGMVKI